MSMRGLAVAFISVLLCTCVASLQVIGTSPSAGKRVQDCIQEYADGLDEVQANLSWAIRQHPLKMAQTSQRNLTICAGSGTSGTRSLHYGLGRMDVCSWHFNSLSPWHQGIYSTLHLKSAEDCHKTLQEFDYTSLPAEVEAIGDSPIAEVFLDMFLSFPNAKVILVVPPSMEWAERRLQFAPHSHVPIQQPCGISSMQMQHFTIPQSARFEELKNDLVKCMVPDENLLVFSPWTDTPARMETIMDEIATFMGRVNEKNAIFPGVGPALQGRYDDSVEASIATASIANACNK